MGCECGCECGRKSKCASKLVHVAMQPHQKRALLPLPVQGSFMASGQRWDLLGGSMCSCSDHRQSSAYTAEPSRACQSGGKALDLQSADAT
eukprot:364156-Chlamydomonas_euryale.AAC.3